MDSKRLFNFRSVMWPLTFVAFGAIALMHCMGADAAKKNPVHDDLEAIIRSTPRLDDKRTCSYRSFQFEYRAAFALSNEQTGHVRCVIERYGNRGGLLVLSQQGVPVMQVNHEGIIALSSKRLGELDCANGGGFGFRCTGDQAIGAELSFFGPDRRPAQIEVDFAGLIEAALSRPHKLHWDRLARTYKIVEPSGLITIIRLSRRPNVGFPIELFSQTTAKGHGIMLTNIVVSAPNREDNCGPRRLTYFGRNSNGEHPSNVLHHVDATEQWLAQVASPARLASVDDDENLVKAGEELESWIQLDAALENRPTPAILDQQFVRLPDGFFPQQRSFKRLAIELTDAAARPAMQTSRAPFRVDLIGYPRTLSAAYVEAWLGFRRTRRLYGFLVDIITDAEQPGYNRVRGIALLGRIGAPPIVDVAELDARFVAKEPHLLACWSACRLLLGHPRPEDITHTSRKPDWPNWPWSVQTMSMHGLVNCGEIVETKDSLERFLAVANQLGDGNLWGTDFITALAASGHVHELLERIKRRELGDSYSRTALLALESECPPGTNDRTALGEAAKQLALDENLSPELRSIATNVAATGGADAEFVRRLLAAVHRFPDSHLIRALPLFALGHLSLLADDRAGLPPLVRSHKAAIRRATAKAICEIPTQIDVSQSEVDTLLPTLSGLLDNDDEVVLGCGVEALRRLHRPGVNFSRTVIKKLVKKAQTVESIVQFCQIISLLERISGEAIVAQCIEPGALVPLPSGAGMDWWQMRRNAIVAAVDEWWKTDPRPRQ